MREKLLQQLTGFGVVSVVEDADRLDAAVTAALRSVGHLDAVVNNAGSAMAGALEGFRKRAEAMKTDPEAGNPQQVADAIVKVIETPAGQRPARVPVDATNRPFVPRLNEAHEQVQRELLQSMGMGALPE